MKYYTALEANPLASSCGHDSLTTYSDCAVIGNFGSPVQCPRNIFDLIILVDSGDHLCDQLI
jgi:hypothetical protein